MIGMDREMGKAIPGIAHLKQSIIDLLTTPIGTRVMRRDYGSRLLELVDRPMNPALGVEITVAVAEALYRWEHRLRLTRVRVEDAGPEGRLSLALEGIYRPDAQAIELEGLIVG